MDQGEVTQRPPGITVLAILHFVLAPVVVLGGAVLLWVVGLLTEQGIGYGAEPSPSLADEFLLLLRLGRMAGVLLFLMGALKAVIGFGLWKLRKWARILALTVAGLNVVLALSGIASSLMEDELFGLLLGALVASGYGLIIWYLLRLRVKQAFGAAWWLSTGR